MKPRNFSDRRLRRIAGAKLRRGEELTAEELKALQQPKDMRIRGHRGCA